MTCRGNTTNHQLALCPFSLTQPAPVGHACNIVGVFDLGHLECQPGGAINQQAWLKLSFIHSLIYFTYAKVMLILITAHNDVILHFMVFHGILI